MGVDGRRAIEREHLERLLTDTAVDDLYEFRMLLETEAAARAAERAGPQERAEVAAALRRYEEAAEAGVDAYRRDVEFHAAVAKASMNSAYSAALAAVSNTLVAVRRATDTVPGAVQRASIEHQAIAEFILERNSEGARAAMVVHIETARRTLAVARAAQRHGDSAL
ncbi:FadR/GntR family transcriptional regulator [Agrococcus sp. KRD186]|uniref:FadR/GntR family transcriptional regulator n=1 Tax=Agrococcus sp. KRD186 TaxID=2729730 RepID=UPI001F498772|nr:FCD domain-containing protein [Agrococcus sp. KRD186]